MNKCSSCGRSLPDNAKFCNKCGGKAVKIDTENLDNIVCEKCCTDNIINSKFCRKCGSSLNKIEKKETIVCSKCNFINSNNANFCKSCGQPLKNKSTNISQINSNSAQQNIYTESKNSYSKPVNKTEKIKPKTFKVVSIIALVLVVCIFALIYRESIVNLFNPSANSSKPKDINIDTVLNIDDINIEYNPVKMPVSGTKAFKISPIDGLVISAVENALDKDRSFTTKKVNNNELYQLKDSLPTPDLFLLQAFEVDSGMKAEEQFPGEMVLEFDLDKINIPTEFRNDLKVVRL